MPHDLGEAQRKRGQFFDRLGFGLDLFNLIDFKAYTSLLANADMPHSRSVLEFGCGRGILAYRILKQFPGVERLTAVDLSRRCVEISQYRLAAFGRARCHVGSLEKIPLDLRFDRIFSSFCLDTMPADEIRRTLSNFHRLLQPGGLICLMSAAPGITFLSRMLMKAWQSLYALNPKLVGGTRVMSMQPFLRSTEFALEKRCSVVSRGFCSEVVIARRVPTVAPEAFRAAKGAAGRLL